MSSMWDPAGRRSSIQIVKDMLDLIHQGESNKTIIMCKVNINSGQVQRYLTWLTQSRLLDKIVGGDNSVSYKITLRGLELLSNLESLTEMLRRKEDNDQSQTVLEPQLKIGSPLRAIPANTHGLVK